MMNVIAVIDIGKTNKKILLFNEEFDVYMEIQRDLMKFLMKMVTLVMT